MFRDEIKKIDFNDRELSVIKGIIAGKTFVELEIELKDTISSRQLIKYILDNSIKKKLLKIKKIDALKQKVFIDLSKDFKGYEHLIGRIIGSEKNKTFVPKKLIVIDRKFKTNDNTDFKPLAIQKLMNHDSSEKETPTPLKQIARLLGTTTGELKGLIKALFVNKVFVFDNHVISTAKTLSVIVSGYCTLVKDDVNFNDTFKLMKKDSGLNSFLHARGIKSSGELSALISLRHNEFSLESLIQYKGRWELKKYFYKYIMSNNVENISEIINKFYKEAKRIFSMYGINGFSVKALKLSFNKGFINEVDDDMLLSVLRDCKFFSETLGAGKYILLSDCSTPYTPNADIINQITNEFGKEDTDIIMEMVSKYGRTLNRYIIEAITQNGDIKEEVKGLNGDYIIR